MKSCAALLYNYIVCCLILTSASTHSAEYSIPIGYLYYESGGNNFAFPSDPRPPICNSNGAVGSLFEISGNHPESGQRAWKFNLLNPAIVVLNERDSDETVQIRITPLGVRKTGVVPGRLLGASNNANCVDLRTATNFSIARQFGENPPLVWGSQALGNDANFSTSLAFEVINAGTVTPGVYSISGGYQFQESEYRITSRNNPHTGHTFTTPSIPNLTLVVGHVFKIYMPYTSISLNPSSDDNIHKGELWFRAHSNQKYTITMACSGVASGDGRCNFDGTSMKLGVDVRFPQQGNEFSLKHNIPVDIEGTNFTDSKNPYTGYIDFTLEGVRDVGLVGSTYSDTVTLVFEADF